jgi:threonylcarbamoyladenosine tRNA methylthiotransferase MtaB
MKKEFDNVKFYISTLGCKVNQSESNAISDHLIKHGADLSTESNADILIVNSCAVTNQAASKTRHELRRLKRENEEALLIFMGCYVEQKELEEDIYDIADVLIGTKNKSIIYEVILEYLDKDSVLDYKDLSKRKNYEFEELSGLADSDRTRAQVRIQDGCENFCSYCIIPYLRGPERSRKKENVIKEIKELELLGYKEVVLTGIHLGSYGNDFKDNYKLSNLITEILDETSIPRIRLSSIEPNEVDEEIIELYASKERLMPHLHIPLQSGSDKILKKMNRKYTLTEYRKLINSLRKRVQGIAITTDLIVGFPGETKEDFDDIYKFVKEMEFSQMHVFRYSKREGTVAADLKDQIDGNISKERSKIIRDLAKEMGCNYTKKMIGNVHKVLIEQKIDNNKFFGHADNYTKVIINSDRLTINEIYRVKIIDNSPYSVKGVVV